MDVRLNPLEPEYQARRTLPWPLLATAGALVLVVLLVWGGLAWWGSARSGDAPDSGSLQTSAPVEAGNETAAQMEEQDATVSNASDQVEPQGASSAAAGQAGEPQLPPSRNARNDIGIGTRVQILPGFGLALRSEAGALAGEVVGYLADEQQALVVGGPVLRQGQTDTIVWWLVELDGGVEAWAAANTSETTLLVPVE